MVGFFWARRSGEIESDALADNLCRAARRKQRQIYNGANMMTVVCKEFRVRGETDGRVTLEIEEATSADLLPRLIKRADAAARFAVSPRHFDSLAAKAGIRPVEGLPIRYRESDLLKMTRSADEPLCVSRVVVPMSTHRPKSAAPTASSPLSRRNTKAPAAIQRSQQG